MDLQKQDKRDGSNNFLDEIEAVVFEGRKIKYGPEYHVQTSQGKDLVVTTFYDYVSPQGNKTTLYMIAQDGSSVVAYRKTKIAAGEAEGKITTFTRDAGIATALELAHIDFLGREAARTGSPITYRIIDENSTTLSEIKKPIRFMFWQWTDKKLIEAKTQERLRWEALYGPNGMFGADASGRLVVSPKNDTTPLETIAKIALTREYNEENGRRIVRGRSTVTEGDKSQLEMDRVNNFRNKLRPMLIRSLGK